MDLVTDLAKLIAPGAPPLGPRLRQGKIIAVANNHTATVTIGGDSTQIAGVAVASHVCPVPGRACWLLVDGRDAFLIALIGSGGVSHGKQRQSAPQTIPNNAFTALDWTSRTDVVENGVTQGNTGLTVKNAGLWLVIASTLFPTNTAGFRQLGITANGSTAGVPGALSASPPNAPHELATTATVPCAVGDVVGAVTYQNSGAALNTVMSSSHGFIIATWLGPLP